MSGEVEISTHEEGLTNSPHWPLKIISELNGQVALLRQMLIIIGQPKDSPEHREKIRRLRRQCVDACKHVTQLLLPQIHSDIAAGAIPVDTDHLVHFFCCTQLLARELKKSYRLIHARPLDMTAYYESKRGPQSGMAGVLGQIILCKQMVPDFNQEELCSIRSDGEYIQQLIDDMQEFMPLEGNQGRAFALAGEDQFSVWAKKRIKTRPFNKPICQNLGTLCCFRTTTNHQT